MSMYRVDCSKTDAVGSLHQTARGFAVTAKVRFCELQEVKKKNKQHNPHTPQNPTNNEKKKTTPKQNFYRLKLSESLMFWAPNSAV